MWKRKRGLALVAATLALVLAGCSAASQPSTLEARLANLAKDVVVPLEAKNRKNPIPAGDTAAALVQYGRSCAVCHGSDGRSQTVVGRSMYPPAMDLTSPHVKHWSDAELFWIIQNGVRFTGMPAWKDSLNERQVWETVMAIRELQKSRPSTGAEGAADADPDQLAKEGAILFRQEHCIGCHALRGEGEGPGPDLSNEGRRGRSDAWMIGHLLDPGAYTSGSLMPPAANLNARQLRALVVFLQRQRVP